MTRHVFEELIDKQPIKRACSGCGRTFQRTISVSQTVNPFNKNANGEMKTRQEIMAENMINLKAQVNKFELTVQHCGRCEG